MIPTTLVIGGSGDVDAVDVEDTPTGGIASTNVQAALAELDAEKEPISERTLNTQTIDYTLVAGDAVKTVVFNKATAGAVTVPTNASVPFAVGVRIPVRSIGAGLLTLTASSGVSIVGVPYLLQYSQVDLVKTATNTWLIVGATRVEYPIERYGALVSAADNATAIQAAIDAANAAGGGVVTVRGNASYLHSGITGKSGVTLRGQGRPTAGATLTSFLTYTGTGSGSAISAQNAQGFRLEGLTLLSNSAAWTGRMVDLRNVSGSDTAYAVVENCYLGFTGVTNTVAILIDLDKCIDTRITGCHLVGGAYGIQGKSVNGNYSIAISVRDCVFHTQGTGHIHNLGQAWTVQSCTFEGLSGGTAGAIVQDSGVVAAGCNITGNWSGDATGGTVYVLDGDSYHISGNWIGATSGVGISTPNAVNGLVIVGNRFVSCTDAIRTVQPSGSSSALGWVIAGNTYSSVTNKLTGALASGSLYHDSLTLNGNTNAGLTLFGFNAGGQATFNANAKFNSTVTLTQDFSVPSGKNLAVGGAVNAVYQFFVTGTHPSSATTVYGSVVQPTAPATATSGIIGTFSNVQTIASAFTCSQAVGHQIGPATIGSGSTVNTTIGMVINAQTGGAVANVGLSLGAATGTGALTVWVSSDADSTTAPGGITFGSSKDTSLFRSAANTLTTGSLSATGSVTVAAGSGGQIAKVGGTIQDFTADAGNVTTAETDIFSYTTPAGILSTTAHKLRGEYAGILVNSASTKQIKLYFGGTAIWDSTAMVSTAAGLWRIKVLITRVSASVVRYDVAALVSGATGGVTLAVGELTGLTLSNTNVLKLTGTAAGGTAATNDIVGKLGSVDWVRAA